MRIDWGDHDVVVEAEHTHDGMVSQLQANSVWRSISVHPLDRQNIPSYYKGHGVRVLPAWRGERAYQMGCPMVRAHRPVALTNCNLWGRTQDRGQPARALFLVRCEKTRLYSGSGGVRRSDLTAVYICGRTGDRGKRTEIKKENGLWIGD